MLAAFWRRVGLIARACLTRAGIAFVALLLSVAGSAVLCGLLGWAIFILSGAEQWGAITNIAYGLLGTVSLILWSIGKLLAGKLAIDAEIWKFKFSASQQSLAGESKLPL